MTPILDFINQNGNVTQLISMIAVFFVGYTKIVSKISSFSTSVIASQKVMGDRLDRMDGRLEKLETDKTVHENNRAMSERMHKFENKLTRVSSVLNYAIKSTHIDNSVFDKRLNPFAGDENNGDE